MTRAPLLVLMSHGHDSRPDVPLGVGAAPDGYVELDHVHTYMGALRVALRGWGVPCWTVGVGTLRERQERAVEVGSKWLEGNPGGLVIYAACHLNAGAPATLARGHEPPASVYYDARSTLGRKVARSVAEPLGSLFGVKRTATFPARRTDWTSNAMATIRRIYDGPADMCGVCLEPLYLDHLPHRAHLTPGGLRLVGLHIARGMLDAARVHGSNADVSA